MILSPEQEKLGIANYFAPDRTQNSKTPMKPNDRRCVSCRQIKPKEEFWRIVRVFPSGKVQLDQGMGRSAYICPNKSCLQTAQKKNRLGRSLHAPVPEALYQALWQRLTHSNSQSQTKLE